MNRKQKRDRLKRLNQGTKRRIVHEVAARRAQELAWDLDEEDYFEPPSEAPASHKWGSLLIILIWGGYGWLYLGDTSVLGWYDALRFSPVPVILTLLVAFFAFWRSRR